MEYLVKAVELLRSKMNVPTRLKDLGIPEDEFKAQIEGMIDQIQNDICTLIVLENLLEQK